MSDDERPPREASAGERDDAHEALRDDEHARVLEDELRRLKVADLVRDMMVSLVAVGYQKLGLTAETRPLRDLDDARLAIEALRAMVDVMARESAAADIEAFRSTLDAMQLNYVRAADSGGPAPAKDEKQTVANDAQPTPAKGATPRPAKVRAAKGGRTGAGGAAAAKGGKPPAKPKKKQARVKKRAAGGEPTS